MAKDKEDDFFTKPKDKKSDKVRVLVIVVIAVSIAVVAIEAKVYRSGSNETEANATEAEDNIVADDAEEMFAIEPDVTEVESESKSLMESLIGPESAFEKGSYVTDYLKNEEEFGMLIPIPDHKYLYYAKGTGIVYIVQSARSYHEGYGFMAPFYSKNGNLYRYEDGFFTEIQS